MFNELAPETHVIARGTVSSRVGVSGSSSKVMAAPTSAMSDVHSPPRAPLAPGRPLTGTRRSVPSWAPGPTPPARAPAWSAR